MKILIYMLFLAAAPLSASETQTVYLTIEVVVMKNKKVERFEVGYPCVVLKEENGRYQVKTETNTVFWVDKEDVKK